MREQRINMLWKCGKCFINIRILSISTPLPCSLNQTLISLADICGKGVEEPVCLSLWEFTHRLRENPKQSLASADNEDIDLTKLPYLPYVPCSTANNNSYDLFSI